MTVRRFQTPVSSCQVKHYSLTFTTPGTYTAHCIYHDDTENMVSTIVVM